MTQPNRNEALREQIEALWDAAEHWACNYYHAAHNEMHLVSFATHKCACCIKWYNESCIGCPIREQTGQPNCRDTPYALCIHDRNLWHAAKFAGLYETESHEELVLAIKAEYQFLVDLAWDLTRKAVWLGIDLEDHE